MSDQNKELRQAAKQEQLAALGKFVQDFEFVCDELRSLFIWSFHKGGLAGRGQILATMTIRNQYITADPLVSIVSAVYCETVKSDPAAVAVMRDVEKRFKKLAEKRNSILHGTWLIGSYLGDNFSEMHSASFKITKNGLEKRELPRSAIEFASLSEEAEQLRGNLRELCGLLNAPENFQSFKEFVLKDGKYILRDRKT